MTVSLEKGFCILYGGGSAGRLWGGITHVGRKGAAWFGEGFPSVCNKSINQSVMDILRIYINI